LGNLFLQINRKIWFFDQFPFLGAGRSADDTQDCVPVPTFNSFSHILSITRF